VQRIPQMAYLCMPGGYILVRELRYNEVRRILLPLRWVNKDDHARLRFLVSEEHAGAKPVRCSPEAILGVHILRPTLFELLVCGGNLAGRERFTSTAMHYDAHSAHSFPTARSNGKTDHLLC
jgi:hypothetical protein